MGSKLDGSINVHFAIWSMFRSRLDASEELSFGLFSLTRTGLAETFINDVDTFMSDGDTPDSRS